MTITLSPDHVTCLVDGMELKLGQMVNYKATNNIIISRAKVDEFKVVDPVGKKNPGGWNSIWMKLVDSTNKTEDWFSVQVWKEQSNKGLFAAPGLHTPTEMEVVKETAKKKILDSSPSRSSLAVFNDPKPIEVAAELVANNLNALDFI